jgi:YesN/AraC family two-component response regulator
VGRREALDQLIKKLKEDMKTKRDQRIQKLVEGGMGVVEATDIAEHECQEEEKTKVDLLEVQSRQSAGAVDAAMASVLDIRSEAFKGDYEKVC